MRVEQALRLLPDLEALAPLRALLVSSSHPDERAVWASAGPYLTVGKREIDAAELREQMKPLLRRITEHVAALYQACADALERQATGDGTGAVKGLLRGGRLEEAAERLPQARAWYAVALGVAEGLPERRPEIETLDALGQVYLALGQYPLGARHYQRNLALAEAELDHATAISACLGLGGIALAQGQWVGAHAWYARGVQLAEAGGDQLRLGQLRHQLAVLADKQGDRAAAAEYVRRARDCFEALGAAREMALTLNTQGRLDAHLGRHGAAAASYREALAWAHRVMQDPSLEVVIRLNLAELLLETDRLLDADEEIRRAEQLAIAHNLPGRLVRIYTLLGTLRGRQRDETGFVFFEQAIELCRTLARSPAVEAQVYYRYGLFRDRLGGREEARAYLERARELFTTIGEAPEVERVEAELERLSA